MAPHKLGRDGTYEHVPRRGGPRVVPSWQRVLAIWLTICMVVSLVPVTPGMADEVLGQEDLDVIVEDNTEASEEPADLVTDETALESSDNGATEQTVTRGGTPDGDSSTLQLDGLQPSEVPPLVTAEPTATDDVEGVVVQSGDLAYGEVEGVPEENAPKYAEGYFIDGVGGQTYEGTTPKIYFDIMEDSVSGERYVNLVYFEDGITSLTIPTAIRFNDESLKVRGLTWDGHSQWGDLTSVIFYDNSELETIGSTAFYECDQLTSIELPNSLKTIGYAAFAKTGLTSISIPDTVTTLESQIFSGCTALTTVTLPNNETITAIPNGMFYDCTSLSDTIFDTLPSSITTIEGEAFKGCAFTSITIPASVTTIEGYAFADCEELLSVSYAEGSQLTEIGDSCFFCCEKLGIEAVHSLPASVTTIGARGFSACDLKGDLVIPDTVANIGSMAFCGCDGITSVKLPANPGNWGAGLFDACDNLTTVTWPTSASFTTIPSRMFCNCALSDPAIITSIPATVTTIGSEAFSGCKFEEVDIPDTVNVIKQGAFDCETLKRIEWPQDNGNFDTFYGGFENVSTAVANEILANLPPSVKTIGHGEYDSWGIFGENLTAIDLSATNIQTIEKRSFYDCEGVTSITLPNTLRTIGEEAFAHLGSAASGIDIVVPASVTHIGYGAFDNCDSWDRGNPYENRFFASSIHIMNPDFTFDEPSTSRYSWEYAVIGSTRYDLPFWYGQTIYASATDSRGRESFIHKWAQTETTYKNASGYEHPCTVEELGQHLQNEDGVPAYTFEWVEVTAPVTVSGTVPSGATLTMTQGTGTTRKVTNVEVASNGSFSTEASAGMGTVLRVSLAGYYDYTLTRSASAMKSSWTGIVVTTDQMEKIPVKGYMTLSLKWATAGEEEEDPTYANIASEDTFDYALVDAQGRDVAFTTKGTVLTITANNDDDPTNNIAEDAALTLTATPKASAAQAYKVGATTVTATLADGTFDAILPAWGTAAITTNSTDEGSSSSMRLMLFKGNRCVASTNTLPGQTYTTAKLEAGGYTVVAIDSAAVFTTSSLTGLTALGLDGFVTRQDIIIVDGQKTEATLNVTPLNTSQIMANAGLTRAALSLKSKTLVFGGEQTATIDYQLDPAKATAAEFRLVLPTGTTISSCGSSETEGRVDCNLIASAEGEDTYAINLTNAAGGKLYVKFVATTAGSCTVGLSVIANGVTVPVSSSSYTCNALTMQLSQDVLTSRTGSATIYAAPIEDVTLAVTNLVGMPLSTQVVRTGASCTRTVSFALPENVLSGERYYVKASIGTEGSSNYQVISRQVTYIPGASVADFTITNGDNAFQVVKDRQVQEGGVTVLYHVKDKKYAHWGFSMTLDFSGGQNVGNTFTLDVETMGGTYIQIPMTKTRTFTNEEGASFATYTGTYFDEVWLDAYEWAVEHNEGQVWSFDWNKVFVPQSISFPNSLLSSIVTIDPEVLEEVAQRDYEERIAAQEQQFQQYIAEYRESFEEGGDVHRTLEAYDEAMQTIIDVLNDAIRQAAEDAGETVGEDDLIPNHTNTIDYFSEAGVDGVNVDDLIFDDEWEDPYYDPSDEDDWYAELFGSDEFEDEDGNSFELSGDEKQALSEVKAEIDRIVSDADDAEKKFCTGLGVKPDLSNYSSWTGVTADALKGTGVNVTDLTQEGGLDKPIPNNEMGSTGNYVEKKDNYTGFVASDGTKTHEDVTFTEEAASAFEALIEFMSSDAYGVGTLVFDEFKGIYLDRASTMGPLLRSSPRIRRFVTTSLRAVDRNIARGVSFRKAANFVNTQGGNILSIAGTYQAWNDYVDAKALWESTKYDTTCIDDLIKFWQTKDYKTCPERYDCIMALLDEKAACEALCRLLRSRYQHLGADATVTTVTTTVGVAGSITTLGTAGTATSVAGTVYNAGSAIVHADRDLAIEEALATYKNKTAVRKRKCKRCSCPEGSPDCNTPPSGGGGEDGGGTTTYTPENYLDPSGVVYEAVLSNPVEGAKVTVWRSDSSDGSGKVADETFVATGQTNPQVTGANGVFQWDVTTGYYQVVVDDSDAYTGASSAWLPVTPPQLGVNLGVVSKQAPAIVSATAYTDYVEVIFSQWMQTKDVHVTGIDGATCEWVDTEQSGDPNDGDVVFSKVLHIQKPGGFAAGSVVNFGIAADGVTSYNGKGLAAAYASGNLTVTQRPVQILLNVEGDEQGTATELKEQVEATDDIDAYVVDAAGKPLANQRVNVACGNNDMATIASAAGDGSATVTTDNDGKASFSLAAHLPGMTSLTFCVEGTSLGRTVDLVVEGEQVRPNRPCATITDDKTVTKIDASSPKSRTIKVKYGATLTLTADDGDTIYYTTNDTCPCTDGSRTKYTGPHYLKEGHLLSHCGL